MKKGAEAPFWFACAKHWLDRLNPQALQPEPEIYTMQDKDTIIIKAPPGTKTRWVRQSQAHGKKLSDWIVDAVDASTKYHCRKCGYVQGADWLDEGETCPKCMLVQ